MSSDPVQISPLGTFEGDDVLAATVVITRAGDGLSEALDVHPVQLHRGDTVYVVLECEVGEIGFVSIQKTNALARKHKLVTLSATIVDEQIVSEALDRTKLAIEQRKGIRRLPLGGTDPDAPDNPEAGEVAQIDKPTRKSRSKTPAGE
jgi:hypothetical protein